MHNRTEEKCWKLGKWGNSLRQMNTFAFMTSKYYLVRGQAATCPKMK